MGVPTRLELDRFDLRDFRGRNWLLPVRNHNLPVGTECASCWAVTTATILSVRLNLALAMVAAAAPQIEVSPQVLLNCVPGQTRCGFPGSSSVALAYVQAHGVPHESCAPWQNAALPCDPIHTCAAMGNPPQRHLNGSVIMQPVKNPLHYYVESTLRIPPGDVQRMKAELALGPLACGVHAEGLLQYSRGVLMQLDPPSPVGDDHSVAIVGWNLTVDNIPHWIVQNNWGTQWGEEGFARLQLGVNLLGIEGHCFSPKVRLPDAYSIPTAKTLASKTRLK